MSFSKMIWACDPFGSLMFISGATLILLALDWAGGAFSWGSIHVAVPLSIGIVLMVLFGCEYHSSALLPHYEKP